MIDGLLSFLAASPSPFHAAKNLAGKFQQAGFQRLDEANAWSLKSGERYYYTRSDASIVAFNLTDDLVDSGARLVGAHTDSPCLKVKPSPELNNKGYNRLGIEVYGGALLNPWMNALLSCLKSDFSFRDYLLKQVQQENPNSEFVRVLDFNLSFYDTQLPAVVGMERKVRCYVICLLVYYLQSLSVSRRLGTP